MAMLARLQATEDFGDRRYVDRRVLKLQVAGVLPDGPGVDVVIHDLSLTGLLMETWASLSVGMDIEVDLPEAGATQARVVWSTGRYFGCQFSAPIPAAAMSAAILKNPVAPTPRVSAPVQFSRPSPTSEDRDGLSLGTRMRVIIALATLVWAAIFLAMALA
jgi:hypothetical protein